MLVRATLLIFAFVAVLVMTPASAIIIRHDIGYSKYLVRESQYPAVFYLQKKKARKICVATLIHSRWAVTAAHCVNQTPLGETLAAGGRYQVRVASQQVEIDKVVLHPGYHGGVNSNSARPGIDLALLRIHEPLPYPLPIAINKQTDELNRVVTLLGWGFFGLGTIGRQLDDGKFRRAQNRITVANTRLRFTFDDPGSTNSRALALEGVPGLGDSGGPALFETADGLILAGVAIGEVLRHPEGDSRQGAYGATEVYERISLHVQWIERILYGEETLESER